MTLHFHCSGTHISYNGQKWNVCLLLNSSAFVITAQGREMGLEIVPHPKRLAGHPQVARNKGLCTIRSAVSLADLLGSELENWESIDQ